MNYTQNSKLETALLLGFVFAAGCAIPTASGPEIQNSKLKIQNSTSPDPTLVYASYAPASIRIVPLTGIVGPAGADSDAIGTQIRVYVSLVDEFDCQTKSPGIFRFELFQAVARSPEPKGKRINIWPDINLTDPAENDNYWRDFLRVYEFNLDFQLAGDQHYILQVTCLCPNGRRLSADFTIKSP